MVYHQGKEQEDQVRRIRTISKKARKNRSLRIIARGKNGPYEARKMRGQYQGYKRARRLGPEQGGLERSKPKGPGTDLSVPLGPCP